MFELEDVDDDEEEEEGRRENSNSVHIPRKKRRKKYASFSVSIDSRPERVRSTRDECTARPTPMRLGLRTTRRREGGIGIYLPGRRLKERANVTSRGLRSEKNPLTSNRERRRKETRANAETRSDGRRARKKSSLRRTFFGF